MSDGWIASAEPVLCSAGPCQNSGICTNTSKGVFVCQCQSGYSGIFCETTNASPALPTTPTTTSVTNTSSTSNMSSASTISVISATTTFTHSTKTGLSYFYAVILLDKVVLTRLFYKVK